MGLTSIIKVGAKGSEIKFNNVKMLRAISFNDVEKLMLKNDASFLVFERLRNDDMDVVIPLIERIVGRTKLTEEDIYFFKCEDSSNYINFSDLKEMQKYLSFKYNSNIRTYKVGVTEEVEQYRAAKRAAEEEARRKEEEARHQKEEGERCKKEQQEVSETEIDLESLFDTDNKSDDTQSEDNVYNSKRSENTDGMESIVEDTDDVINEVETDNGVRKGVVNLFKNKSNGEIDKQELKEEEEALKINLSSREEKEELKKLDSNTTRIITFETEEEDIIYNENVDDTKEKEFDSAELKELQEELKIKEKRLEVTEERMANLVKIRESLQDKVGFYENLIAKLEDERNVVDVQTKDSEETIAKLNESKHRIKQLELNIINLNNELAQIDDLRADVEERDKIISGLREDLIKARTDDKYKEISVKLEHEVAIRHQLLTLIKNLTDAYIRILDKNRGLLVENTGLKQTNLQLTKSVSELNAKMADYREDMTTKLRVSSEKIRSLTMKVDEFNGRMLQSRNDLEVALKDKEEALNRLNEISIENEKLIASDSDLRSELRTVKSEFEVQKNITEDLKIKLSELEKEDIEKLKEDKKISDMGNSQMMQELGRVKKELQAVRYQIKRRDETIARLEEDKSRIELTNKSLSRNVASAEKLMIDVEYTSKASIIAVFGSGSYGITTTAVSLAKKLPGNVLLLDFDCVNPKIDSWVGMNPMIKELDGLTGIEQSAFGALIKQGVDYVVDRRDLIFRRVSTNRKGGTGVYYFSGIYVPIDLSEFASIDFQQFLNFVGSEYNYIVVDLGRLGGNESTNALIRMFNKIAWRNVMVCLHDKNDLRTTFINSKRQGVSYTKTIWLLNMAKNTKLDDSMSKILKGMTYMTFVRDMSCYGEKMTFTEFGNPNKDRLQDLIEKVTC